MFFEARKKFEVVTIQSSTTETETGNSGTAGVRLPFCQAVAFVLDVTAVGTAAADTGDFFIQTMIDGTNWVDVVHFTQLAGDGGAKRYVAKVSADIALTEFENGTALGAAAVRNLIGDKWRARWAIVDDTTPTYTFSITAIPM